VTQLLARIRWLWRGLVRSRQLDGELDEEMRLHVELHAERLMREQRLDAAEARRRAFVAFGGVERYKEEGRDARGLRFLGSLALDARLGVRMLVKHRWLTLVGGLAMAVAIAMGAMFFQVLTEFLEPALPVEDGERVVALHYATSVMGSPERRVTHDFIAWRQELESIEQLGAFRTAEHNLVSGNAPPQPIEVAEMTAAGFAVARTRPLLGRYLLPADELPGAPAVVVIGHRVWRSRFGGDANIAGRTLSLGGALSTVVGVMPEGFEFPLDHHVWIPLRLDPVKHARLEGPQIHVFGRLAPGVTLAQAQAELTTVGRRAAAAHPEAYGRLRLTVLPYTREHGSLVTAARVWFVRILVILVGMLTFVVAVNLAILVYARTVTRLGELAVRTALGASRRRILTQLFIEALLLTGIGAAFGLVVAQTTLGSFEDFVRRSGRLPYWIGFDLSIDTVVYAFGLAVMSAFVMGVLPGLKATGRGLTATLHELNGRSGTRLGATWTSLVVAQIAVAVAALPAAVYLCWQIAGIEVDGPGFDTDRFVVSSVALNDDASAVDADRIRARQLALMARFEAEPGVSAVTFSSFVPGFAGSRRVQFEAESPAREPGTPDVSVTHVDAGLFDAYGAVMLAGRAFTAGDTAGANAVIVNQTFARRFLGDGGALGRRFRYTDLRTRDTRTPARMDSYQVVGVVRDFPSFRSAPFQDTEPVVYHPAAPGELHPLVVSVRFGGAIPDGVADRFRKLGAEVDPALQLRRVVPLSQYYDDVRSVWRYLAWGVGLVTVSVLLLCAAGIYALMSFTVAQRTREIGIRTALGAAPHRILLGIFGRAARQLALGLLLGSLLSGAVLSSTGLGLGRATSLLLAVAATMLVVGLLATLGPARRGLRIQPSEALRADG